MPRLVGQMVDLRITQALPHSLRGEVVAAESVTADPAAEARLPA